MTDCNQALTPICAPHFRIRCQNEGALLRVQGGLYQPGDTVPMCCEIRGQCSTPLPLVFVETPVPVSEPSATAMLLTGIVVLVMLRRRWA